ncbi:MAG: prenyltransferase [Prevotellaceae bacterium]|jgi:1,4-dihydroxy-2-naphthoate octaprenyltransferase|nr:prenyltransferase [Prevotellaceae bacterium]
MKTIKTWFWNTRPHALPQSVMPAVLAVCLASQVSGFTWWLGVLAVVGVAFAHSSLNLFDDYFDYKVKKSDYRNQMAHRGIRARMHKSPYLTSGQATLGNLLTACLVIGGIAALLGAVIFYFRGITVLWIAATAVFLGIEYSGAPLRLSYRGLGEVVIGIMFGTLSMLGVYYSACGQLDWSVLFVSLPVGLLVANIIYVHSIMDFEPDKEVGKMTFAVLLGNKKAMLAALFVLLFVAYASIAVGIITGYLSVYYLFTLVTLPMAVELFRLMYAFVKNPEQQFEPKKWYGPVGNWERLKENGIDWFMLRWLLARNLLTLFCLIIILITFIF